MPGARRPPCPSDLDLASRPLLGMDEAEALERLFGILASGTRLRLLHALWILGDPCMGDLAGSVDMKPAAVSNQLRRLVDLGILATRRHGNHVHYRIVDDSVLRLMEQGLCLERARQKAEAP